MEETMALPNLHNQLTLERRELKNHFPLSVSVAEGGYLLEDYRGEQLQKHHGT